MVRKVRALGRRGGSGMLRRRDWPVGASNDRRESEVQEADAVSFPVRTRHHRR